MLEWANNSLFFYTQALSQNAQTGPNELGENSLYNLLNNYYFLLHRGVSGPFPVIKNY